MPHPRERTLVRYADGEVSERLRGRVAGHLLACARCRAVVDAHAVVQASASQPPSASEELLVGILNRRAAGERVLLPTTPIRSVRRTWRIAALAASGAAAILAVSLVPAGGVGSDQAAMGEEQCMSGMRSAFYTLVLGSGLACADAPTVLVLPDSAFRPVSSLVTERIAAGTYVYEDYMWTDGLVASPQRHTEYTLRRTSLGDMLVWEVRAGYAYRFVAGRYVRTGNTEEAWFDRTTLQPVRSIGYAPDGRPWIEWRATPDSIVQRWGPSGTLSRRVARPRHPGIATLGITGAHLFAVLVSLPLAEGWAGEVNGNPFVVVGEEEVTVPAGTFLCWRLESPESQERRGRWPVRQAVRVWVAVDEPLVVRYESGPVPDRRETVLVSFEQDAE